MEILFRYFKMIYGNQFSLSVVTVQRAPPGSVRTDAQCGFITAIISELRKHHISRLLSACDARHISPWSRHSAMRDLAELPSLAANALERIALLPVTNRQDNRWSELTVTISSNFGYSRMEGVKPPAQLGIKRTDGELDAVIPGQ